MLGLAGRAASVAPVSTQAAGEKVDIRGRMDPTGFRKAEVFQEKTWVVSPVSPPAQTRVVGPGQVGRLGWGWGGDNGRHSWAQ